MTKFLAGLVLAVGLAFAVHADDVKTPKLGLSHLNLGGGVHNVLTDTDNTNSISGATSSTFYWNINTNAVTGSFTGFVDGQSAQLWLHNNHTGATTVTLLSPTLVIPIATNESKLVFVTLTDSTYRLGAITNSALVKP